MAKNDDQFAVSSDTNPPESSLRMEFEQGLFPPFINYQPLPQLIDTVTPLAGIQPDGYGGTLPGQNIDEDLAWIRAEMPFLPITRFPQSVVSLYLAAGVARDLNVPDGGVIGRFMGNGDYYVNPRGRAILPSSAILDVNESYYKPDGMLFYLGNITQFSVVAPNLGTVVQLQCWFTSNHRKG